jgi:hypothetical protein
MDAHQDAALLGSERRESSELGRPETQRLFDEHVRAGIEGGANGCGMHRRRAGYIDEVRRLTVEHQIEVVVHADAFDQPNRLVSSCRDGIVGDPNTDIVARAPSGQMGLGSDLAES